MFFFFSPSYAYSSVLKKINCITILVKGPLRGQEQEVEVNTKMNKQTNSASTSKPKSELRKWFTCILLRRLNFCSLVKGETATAVKFANWSEFQHVSLIITIGILNPFFLFGNFGSQVK